MNVAWVTGSEGFIGSHMVDFLIQKDWVVVASVMPKKPLNNLEHLIKSKDPKFILKEIDMKDQSAVEKVIVEYKPSAIFHFAAQSTVKPSWEDPKNTIEVNVIGAIYIFEAVKKHKINTKIIVACSSAAYGNQSKEEYPLKETNHLRPVHPYGISKAAQEMMGIQYWLNFKIPCVMLRFFNQTGPRKDNDACSEFGRKVAKIASGKASTTIEVGNLETYRDITGIKDTLQAVWLAYTKGEPGEVYNVCSGKPTKIRDVLEYFIKLSGKQIIIKDNTEKLMRITDEPIILGDNSKICNKLGYKSIQDLHSLLDDIYSYWMNYYKTNND